MILDKEVEIKINAGNYKHFKSLNYIFSGVGDIIKINTTDLMTGSAFKINCICLNCKIVVENVLYKNYIKQTSNNDIYLCKRCSITKRIRNNIIKYGVEHVSQLESLKDKKKKNNLEKYGTESYFHSLDFKSKMTEKYGVEFPLKNKELRQKAKETTFKNFGVFYPKQSYDVIKKTEINSNIKYGVKHYSQTDEYKKKYKKTCLEKYGVDNPSKTDDIIFKIKNIKIKNGIQLPDDQVCDFLKYRRIVNKFTKKYRKNLFENWNGYDYYDGEYIKDYSSLKSTNRLYPTIDHKISVYYGFINNIPPYIICDLKNLCITKRGINSSKNKKIESEFKTS